MASKKGECEDSDFVETQSDDMLLTMPNGLVYKRLCKTNLQDTTEAKINSYCNVANGVKKLKEVLSKEDLEEFRNTAFGYWLDIGELKCINGQLIILLALKHVEPIDKVQALEEISFHIGGKLITFTKKDFQEVSGFKFGGTTEKMENYTEPSDISTRYFKGQINVTREDVKITFESVNKNKNRQALDAVKLGLLYMLGSCIIGNQASIKLQGLYLHLVDDLAKFNSYPWGEDVWRDLVESVRKCCAIMNTSKKPRFNFPGFQLALQIWAYETFPTLIQEKECEMDEKRKELWPRALRWTADGRTTKDLLEKKIFKNEKFEWIEMKGLQVDQEKTNVKISRNRLSLQILKVTTPDKNVLSEGKAVVSEAKNAVHAMENTRKRKSPEQCSKKTLKAQRTKKSPKQKPKAPSPQITLEKNAPRDEKWKNEALNKLKSLEKMVKNIAANMAENNKKMTSEIQELRKENKKQWDLVEECLRQAGILGKAHSEESRKKDNDFPSFDLGIDLHCTPQNTQRREGQNMEQDDGEDCENKKGENMDTDGEECEKKKGEKMEIDCMNEQFTEANSHHIVEKEGMENNTHETCHQYEGSMHMLEDDLGTLHEVIVQENNELVMEEGFNEDQEFNTHVDIVETASQVTRAVEEMDPAIWDITPYYIANEPKSVLEDIPTKQPQLLKDIPTELQQAVSDVPTELPQMLDASPTETTQIQVDSPTEQPERQDDSHTEPPETLNHIPTEPTEPLNDFHNEPLQVIESISPEPQKTFEDIQNDPPQDTEHNANDQAQVQTRQKRIVKCPDKFTHSGKKVKTRKTKTRQGPQKQKAIDGGDGTSESTNVEAEVGIGETNLTGQESTLTSEKMELFLEQGLLSNHKKVNGRKYTSVDDDLKPEEFQLLWGHAETMTKTWYYGFFYPHEWMDDVHVTVAFKFLVMKSEEYGLAQRFAVTDSLFVTLLKKEYDNYLGKRKTIAEAALNSSLLKPILGAVPELGGRWAQCDYVYMPVNTGNHWILAVLDILERCIRLYDSNQRGKTSHHTKPFLPCLQILLHKLMDKLEVYKERKMTEMGDDVLGIVSVNNCPKQQDAVSCGMFFVKMAEYLMMGMEVEEVEVASIEESRKKFATEVLLYANKKD